jgi:hypothetical protein
MTLALNQAVGRRREVQNGFQIVVWNDICGGAVTGGAHPRSPGQGPDGNYFLSGIG